MQQVLGLVLESQDRDLGALLDVGQGHALDAPTRLDRVPVGAGRGLPHRRPDVGLEAWGHGVLEPLGLLVHVVPGNADDIGQKALDQAVARDDLLGIAPAPTGERDRLVGVAGDVAVALEPPDHLMDGRSGQLHRPRQIRPGHRQARLLQPEQRLEVLLLGNGGIRHRRTAYAIGS